MVDFTTDFGERAARHLTEDQIIWLITTDSQGAPQPRPVWFFWNGNTILIFSQDSGFKVKHIRTNPRVALNFNCTSSGGDVVVLVGKAEIDNSPIPAEELQAYLEKYEQGLTDINMTASNFENSYHVAIRVTPTQLRGH
ncbi:MAG: TIGR03667 family PPOX class F420-dependent oxidoreductase [Anaerolineales bacterium]